MSHQSKPTKISSAFIPEAAVSLLHSPQGQRNVLNTISSYTFSRKPGWEGLAAAHFHGLILPFAGTAAAESPFQSWECILGVPAHASPCSHLLSACTSCPGPAAVGEAGFALHWVCVHRCSMIPSPWRWTELCTSNSPSLTKSRERAAELGALVPLLRTRA